MFLDNHPVNTNSFEETEDVKDDKSENLENHAVAEQEDRDGKEYVGDSDNIEDQNYSDNIEYYVDSDAIVDHVDNKDIEDHEDRDDQDSKSIMNEVAARVAKFFAPAADIIPRRFKGESGTKVVKSEGRNLLEVMKSMSFSELISSP